MKKCFCNPSIKEDDRRDPKNNRGISILNTCYKIYSEILNIKLQLLRIIYDTNTKLIPKGTVMQNPTLYLKLLIEKRKAI
jgi:hypothetical protein